MNQLRANSAQRNALLIGAILFVALFVFIALPDDPWTPDGWTNPLTPPPAQAQIPSSGWNLKGWGWSSNIGWISFSCENTDTCDDSSYGVLIGPGGLMSGHAWSNNIGWISFQETSGFPSAPAQQARLENAGGTLKLSGWVRALAGSEASSAGWDGWIKLSSSGTEPDYGISLLPEDGGYSLNGFAWGSSVMGWFNFGDDLDAGAICPGGVCVDPGDLAISCSVTPTQVTGSGTVTWSASVTGPTLGTPQYQWYSGTSPISTRTSLSYNETVSSDATRQVSITDSLTGISVLSTPCSVSVDSNPELTITLNLVGGASATLTGEGETLSANGSEVVTLSPSASVDLTLSGIDTDETVSWVITPLSAGSCSGGTCGFNMPAQDTNVVVTVTKTTPTFTFDCYTDLQMTLRCGENTLVKIDISGETASATSSPALYFKVSSGEGVSLRAELKEALRGSSGQIIFSAGNGPEDGSGTHEFRMGTSVNWQSISPVLNQRVSYRFGLPLERASTVAQGIYTSAICVIPSQGGVDGASKCFDLQYTSSVVCNGTQCPDL